MSEARISLQLPVLDLSSPIQSSFSDSLSQACQEWGFFCVTNHGISRTLFSKVFSLSDHVFSLPADSKLKLGVYTYLPRFRVSPYLQSLRVSGPDFLASAKITAAQLFGHQNTEFEEIMQEYGSKMTELAKRIIDSVLMSLGDERERKLYESEFSKCNGYLRMFNYSPPDEDVEGEEEAEGVGMHTDLSCITILHQDEVGGLQVRSKDGEWADIPPREGCLVVNVGDLLQAWSNGRLRSSQHRVVLKPGVSRHSVAFFWCFEKEKVIVAPEEVVGKGNPRIYKPFLCSDYLKFRESYKKISDTVYDFAGLKQ